MQKILVPLLVSGLLGAQDYVSPAPFTNAEGPSNNVFPFGHLIPFRYVQVHDDVPPMLVSRISFRHDGTSSAMGNGVIHPAHAVTLDAWLSTAATTSATVVAAFANNHGSNKSQVVTNRQYNHPASNPADMPQQFLLDYPLDVPFPSTGPLCWEAQVTARTPSASSIPHDAVSGSSTNPALQVDRAFSGCLASGRTVPMTAAGASVMNWPAGTGTLSVSVTDALANGVVLHVLGFRKTNWNGIPLPFLLPGSATAPSGPCHLYTDAWVVAAQQASAAGAATSSLPVPATPDLNGLAVYSQIWGIDSAANPLGVTTSNLVVHGFVAPFANVPVGRVFLIGSLGANGTTGVRYGLVTRFR